MHEVMAHLMAARARAEKVRKRLDLQVFALDEVGRKFHDRELTQDHLDQLILPALRSLTELERIYGDDFRVTAIERNVSYPDIFEASGTVDLILSSPKYNIIHDWKFGHKPVVISDDYGINPQLAFYAIAAHATLPSVFNRPRVRTIGSIVQPRTDPQLTHTKISDRALAHFHDELKGAIREALAPQPNRQRGDHCEWAPCKATCPLWLGPLLDIPGLTKVEPLPPTPAVNNYGEYLALAKAMADSAADFGKTIDAQLHAYLSQGGIVPGWKLKAKIKQRKWIDEGIVEQELTALGYEPSEIWERKLVPFNKAEATAKRRKVTIPDHLRIAPLSDETTVCPESDPAPKVEPTKLVEQLRESLKQLQLKG